MSSTGLAALPELRAQRRKNRIAQLDWFEAAYRAYLAAFVGGLAIVWLSGTIGGSRLTADELLSVRAHGPAALGLVAALAIAVGLRSGSRGGPMALEPAEVRHVMLAPVNRRAVLMSTAVKVLRHNVFLGLGIGGAIGVMAAQRLPGNRWVWAAGGAGYGALVGLAMAAFAFLASGIGLKRPIATALAAVVVAGAIADVMGRLAWPTTAIGSVGLWPLRVRPLDLVSVLVLAAVTAIGVVRLEKLSLENAERRTALVGQLRFAVTMQDLRTVTVLRRQLTAEAPRRRPLFGVRKRRARRRFPIWGRSWQGLFRTPTGRIVRMVGLSAIVGIILPAIVKGTGALVFISGIGSYLVGLDILEPLAQAVDHVDRTDATPMDRGDFFVRHLPASAVADVVLSLVTAGVAAALTHGTQRQIVAFGAPIVMLTGMAGAAISVLMGAPETSSAPQLLPPEVTGMKIAARAVWPFLVATVGGLPLVMAQRAITRSADPLMSFQRTVLWAGFLVAFVAVWVRHRDAAKKWWQDQMKFSQDQAAERKAARK